MSSNECLIACYATGCSCIAFFFFFFFFFFFYWKGLFVYFFSRGGSEYSVGLVNQIECILLLSSACQECLFIVRHRVSIGCRRLCIYIRSESDENNRASFRPTLHDSIRNWTVALRLSAFPIATDRTSCSHVTVLESGSRPLDLMPLIGSLLA